MTLVCALSPKNVKLRQEVRHRKLSPSQVPTLGQYTVISLIRHVYGEDCSVLIEQFGLF